MLVEEDVTYYAEGCKMVGKVVYDDQNDQPRPVVMIAHDWSGRNDFVCDKARYFAEQGYLGFALDLYGDAKTGETIEEKKSLMEPLINDRKLLFRRSRAAYEEALHFKQANLQKTAAIGFCFGGLCVLDLARGGVELKGVISFHGLLNAPDNFPRQQIEAKILALHGYDDPMVSPKVVDNFCQEMTDHKVDWQMVIYGNTKHAFTNHKVNDEKLGTVYNPVSERRSFIAMSNFLEELFE